jgi:short subunit dehydrogenase-like uncharacterized protein
MSTSERSYDVVVFGATGFTGRLAAEYLARKGREEPVRWAIAGRSAPRLAEVKAALTAIDPACASLGVLEATSNDPASLERLAAQTRVVLTTVGPYAEHGEPLVAACIKEGTDYVDITGEPDFVDGLLDRHHAAARARGVRIVSCCGFDSIPHDLGALFTVEQLPRAAPITVEGFVRAKGTFSGGTWQSAIGAMGNLLGRAKRPREQASSGRTVRGIKPRIRHELRLGAWVCPLPTIDPQIVLRSARALDAYGPDFRYGHYVQVRSALSVAGLVFGVGAVVALAQIAPARELLRKVRGSGEGPSAEERAKGSFQVTFHGTSGAHRVVTQVSGGDPGYTETAKMVAESALCLALDGEKLSPRSSSGGVLTPAEAMGDVLIARLQKAGIRFEVLEKS